METYYRKIVEDLINKYILNHKKELPELLMINGVSDNQKHLSLKEMVILGSLSNEDIEKYDPNGEYKLKELISLTNLILYIINQKVGVEDLENIKKEYSKEFLTIFNNILSKYDLSKDVSDGYSTNEDIAEMKMDIRNNEPRMRYYIKGPLEITNKPNWHTREVNHYNKPTIKILSITQRQKNERKQISNSLIGKVKMKDLIGCRIATDSIIDAFNFDSTIIKELLEDEDGLNHEDIKNTNELINFEHGRAKKPHKNSENYSEKLKSYNDNLEKFRERMNALLEIEEWIGRDITEDPSPYNKGEIINYIKNDKNIKNKSIKGLLESLLEEKNDIFILQREYEELIIEYYKLLKQASAEKAIGNFEKYRELSEEAEMYNRAFIIPFRIYDLENAEEAYNKKIELCRELLLLQDLQMSESILTRDEKSFKHKVKPFIKDLMEKLGGLENSVYEKKEGRKGSPLYLASKHNIKIDDKVSLEIAALPAWIISLGEIVAPHSSYDKSGLQEIERSIKTLIKELEPVL